MKIYKRDGKRFVKMQDYTGMYLQNDWSFAETCNENSIGICVLQTTTFAKVALFVEHRSTWENCKSFCKSIQAHMPTREELFIASKLIKNGTIKEDIYWTSEQANSNSAWYVYFHLDNSFGYCGSYIKSGDLSVLAFVDIPLA